jgi:hypothetical protein
MSKSGAAHDLYEEDFYAWALGQAQALEEMSRRRVNTPLDLPHLAEEVADLGKSERDAVRSQLRRIIEHCLKLEFSRAAPPRNDWKATIDDARALLVDKMSKSLHQDAENKLDELYDFARRRTDRSLVRFQERDSAAALPGECPYTLIQLCADGWYPGNRHGLTDTDGDV